MSFILGDDAITARFRNSKNNNGFVHKIDVSCFPCAQRCIEERVDLFTSNFPVSDLTPTSESSHCI